MARLSTLDIEQWFAQMVQAGASDLYLKVGNRPFFRVDGRLVPQGQEKLTEEDLQAVCAHLMTEEQVRRHEAEHDLNFSFGRSGLGRFRANVFVQRGTAALVIRRIQDVIPTFDALHLPADVLRHWADEQRGLILVTGTTGSGKSTTVASLLQYMNEHDTRHIVTLEDPLEYLFADQQSLMTQREIGIDTVSFAMGLRQLLRQSPDVVYISDLRDRETVESCLAAAEAGMLVISCLHTVNATSTVERVVSFFPPHQHQEIRLQLASLLTGVLSLRLVPCKAGRGRMPACEILVATSTVRELIRENHLLDLPGLIQEGSLAGMQTFHQSLLELYRQGLVTLEEARRYADSQDEFELAINDIRATKDVRTTPTI